MAVPVDRSALVCGLGSCVPTTVVTNDDLAREFDTSDTWIRSRTGIGQRRIVPSGTATSDLAVDAGAKALKSAGMTHVDALVLATTTPDRRCPGTAPEVAARLGLGPVPAFDVNAVCTGFLYALATAAGLIAAGLSDRVLVIGADTFSSIVDPADRSARAIFGDGAGAVVLAAGPAHSPGVLGTFHLASDGTGSELISIRSGGSREPAGRAGPSPDPFFRMEGKKVFRNAVERMVASSRTALADAGWGSDEVDVLVAHQANLRIMNAVADDLGIPRERCLVHLDRVGNTAAASIPLALDDARASGLLKEGDRVLMTAFGGGLTWGSCTVRWPGLQPG